MPANLSFFVGRQATGRCQADRFGPMFAGMTEIVHGLLSRDSPDEGKRFTAKIHLPQFFQRVMQSRLYRAQRTAEGRRNLFQRRPREETEFHDQAMFFRQARHRPANPLGIFGYLRGVIGRPRGASLLAKGVGCVESLAAFRRRRPFRNRCRRMP